MKKNKFIPVTKPLDKSDKFCYDYAKELIDRDINCCVKKIHGKHTLWRELSDNDLLDKEFMIYVNRKTLEGDMVLGLEHLRPNVRFFIS